MDIEELFKSQFYSAADDQSIIEISDTRKVRLTLEQINKMRQIKEARKIEKLGKLKEIQDQYGRDSSKGGF